MGKHIPERGKRYRNKKTGKIGECIRAHSPLQEYDYYVLPDGKELTRENVEVWGESDMEPVEVRRVQDIVNSADMSLHRSRLVQRYG